MTKILLIESTAKKKPYKRDFSDTCIVHCRNSMILTDELNKYPDVECELLEGEYKLEEVLKTKWDVILCSYASPYMPYVPYRQIIDKNPQARLVFMSNDYDLEDNPLLRYAITEKGRTYDMVSSVARENYRHWILGKKVDKVKGTKLNQYIINWCTSNLNSLIVEDVLPPIDDKKKKETIIYYGTFRKHRKEDFARYLQNGVVLSASKKHWKKYQSAGCNPIFIDKLTWEKGKENLRDFQYSLYIEDDHTHDKFANLANRFYEGLMYGAIPVFAPNTMNTIEKSGYIIPDGLILPENLDGNDLVDYCKDLNKNRANYLQWCRAALHLAKKEKQKTLSEIKKFLTNGIK